MSNAVAAVTEGPIVHKKVNGRIFTTVPFPLFEVADMMFSRVSVTRHQEIRDKKQVQDQERMGANKLEMGRKCWSLLESIDVILR